MFESIINNPQLQVIMQNVYIKSFAILVLFFIISRLVVYISEKIILKLTVKTETKVDDLIVEQTNKPISIILLFLGLRFAAGPLGLPEKVLKINNEILNTIIIIMVAYIVMIVLRIIIQEWGSHFVSKTQSKVDDHFLHLFQILIKFVVSIFAFLFVLNAWGIEIGPLLAGLGIGGIAIALALQNILSDMFASFSIWLDRPFEIGDFIIIGTDMGVVKKIGIKTTRIQTLQGEELVVSNQELTTARVQNFKKMDKRRVAFAIGVTYDTPTTKLKKIPGIIKKIIGDIEIADFDRAHFKNFGDFSLNFEIVYYMKSRDYAVYMDTQQEINFKLKQELDKEKVEFAFPTQTIFLQK